MTLKNHIQSNLTSLKIQSEYLPVTQEALDTQYGLTASRPSRFKLDHTFPLIEFNRDNAKSLNSARNHRETKT